MHLPDGFLNDPTCVCTTFLGAAALGTGLAQLRRHSDVSGARIAVVGAGAFAAQMVNLPIDHGTSGHVLGAALAAIVLGPWAAMLAMTVVLVAQCLLFADGGVSTLGANVLNMAVIAVLVSAGVYQAARRAMPGTAGAMLSGGLAAWASVMAAAAACSLELAASGTYALADVLAAMSRVHFVIGAGEALITAGAVGLMAAVVPGFLDPASSSPRSHRRSMIAALALAIIVAGVFAPFASTSPDGLERVAADLQFASLARASDVPAIAADYVMPGVSWEPLAIAIAGLFGIAVVYAATYGASRAALARVRKI